MLNLVAGAGITGLTVARKLAEGGEKVLVAEKLDVIGGNCRDLFDANGCYVQSCGPHIFHTADPQVWAFLSRFTRWHPYRHRVLASVDGMLLPLPFDARGLRMAFPEEYPLLRKKLQDYSGGKPVSVLELKGSKDPGIRRIGEYAYDRIYANYTRKQWGVPPGELEPGVFDRVRIFPGEADCYFPGEPFQGIPCGGYSALFREMAGHENITLMLRTDYRHLKLSGPVRKIITGPIDEYYSYEHGPIAYRRIRLQCEEQMCPSYQENSVINYPNEHAYTRITEYNKFLGLVKERTVIGKEYPGAKDGFLAYPVPTKENRDVIAKYVEKAEREKDAYFAGRLAECRYYDMDDACRRGLDIAERILCRA